jgi:hypothetical protein
VNEPPCHTFGFKLAAHGSGDGRGEFVAGHCVAGKAEARELWKCFANRRDAQERGCEIWQISPFVRNVERAGVGNAAVPGLLGEHEIEPRAVSAAIKISRAHNDGAHAALGRFRDAIFDRDAQLSLVRGRSHRRILVDHQRERRAVIVEIAREEQCSAGRFRRANGRIGERQRLP